jgi:hypothetical protein
MTFRIDDLTVAVLPDRYAIEAADCTKCTKCTLRTGGPSGCEDTITSANNCCDGHGDSSTTKKRTKSEDDFAILMAQLDEVLVSAR